MHVEQKLNNMNRILSLSVFVVIFQYSLYSQEKSDSFKTALLIVDIQNFYFPGNGPGLVNAEQASLNAQQILHTFRENNQLVVHVRHQSEMGADIHKNVEPISTEKVITKEEVNSFQNTELLDYLKSNRIKRLVVIGMQTHMCLEAAVRAAHDFGFDCVVVQDACATRDLKFAEITVNANDVHASTLATIKNGAYGKVIDLKDFIENTEKYLFQAIE